MERFFAKDMKSALTQVKEALGPDAIIVSNQKVAGGVEVVATVDATQSKPPELASVPEPAEKETIKSRLFPQSVVDSLDELLSRQSKQKKEIPKTILERQQQEKPRVLSPKKREKSSGTTEKLTQELHMLRGLLEHQISHLMWQELERTDPLKAHFMTQLQEIGFTQSLAEELTRDIPKRCEQEQAWQAVRETLLTQLKVGEDDIIQDGGIVTLLGPTGVGKTTTLAKLAARFAIRYGKESVALVSCDTFRIGAFEQLHTFGKIIGCLVKKVENAQTLSDVLHQLADRRLVLVDTAGMGQRDQRLQQQLHELTADIDFPNSNYLVMSTTNQRDVLRDTVDYFQRVPLQGVILTKLDESLSLGSALNVCLEKNLTVSYVTDGQRVPEDLHVAKQLQLLDAVIQAMSSEQKQPYFWQENKQPSVHPSILSEE